jgi:hypothetical protein
MRCAAPSAATRRREEDCEIMGFICTLDPGVLRQQQAAYLGPVTALLSQRLMYGPTAGLQESQQSR